MKKRCLKVMIYGLIFSWVLLPCIASAEPTPPVVTEEYQEEVPVADIAQKLGLSDEQKEQLKQQRYEAGYKAIEIGSKLKLKELELRRELEKKEIDKAAVNRIVEEIKTLQASMLEQRVDSVIRTKEILTPEQFEKLQSSMQHKKREDIKKQGNRFFNWKRR